MIDINYYKLAPTFLYKGKTSKLFQTQEEVDEAWEDGWYGPPWLDEQDVGKPLISSMRISTKDELALKVSEDSRYSGLSLDPDSMTRNTMEELISSYENAHGLIGE